MPVSIMVYRPNTTSVNTLEPMPFICLADVIAKSSKAVRYLSSGVSAVIISRDVGDVGKMQRRSAMV